MSTSPLLFSHTSLSRTWVLGFPRTVLGFYPHTPSPPPPYPTVAWESACGVSKSRGGRSGGNHRGHGGKESLTFQRRRPDAAPTPADGCGGNFPRAERRTLNLLGARCLPGGGGGDVSGDRRAQAAAALAHGPGPGFSRPRTALLRIARRYVRPAACSPRDAGGSCSRPPARRPHLPATALSLPFPRAPSPPQASLSSGSGTTAAAAALKARLLLQFAPRLLRNWVCAFSTAFRPCCGGP